MGRGLISGAVAAIVLIGSAIPASSQVTFEGPLPGGGQRKILKTPPTLVIPILLPPPRPSGCNSPVPWTGHTAGSGGGVRPRTAFRTQSYLPVWAYPYQPGYSVYNPYRHYPNSAYSPRVEAEDETSRPERAWALRAKSRESSKYSMAKAKESIAAGDSRFAEGKYLSAVKQYQAAARMAPELAEPHFRHGLALIAHGNYAGASRAFRRGLELRTNATDLSFSLDEICGPGIVSVTDERLAARMQQASNDGDLFAAQGMQFYFTGNRQRAALYLSQAAQHGTLSDELIRDFVPRPKRAKAAPGGARALTKVGF